MAGSMEKWDVFSLKLSGLVHHIGMNLQGGNFTLILIVKKQGDRWEI
jgi:hypothetical protein